ncbi:MAG: DUF1232 domain-containing protein [Chloroflexota bacterium]|nr:MAG: hypothetical protein DIU68_12745 [Chloroflexota bacterium]
MIQSVLSQIRLTWRLLRDPRVPLWTKAIPLLAALYIVSPVDVLPDIIPGLGQLDDLGILLAGLRLFESAVPENIVNEHRGFIIRR